MLNPPFTRDEVLEAFGRAFIRDENRQQRRLKPRASALASCARQQAYDMSATPHDPIGTIGSNIAYDADLTAEQGRAFEDLMSRTLETMGVTVADRQIELPEQYPVSGHPDGSLVLPTQVRQSGDVFRELKWGVEFKHLGRYGYLKTIKNGLRKAHPNYILQGGLYGDALGWDAVLFIVSSQDASSIRGEATASLRYKNPHARWAELIDWHPKLHMETLEIREVRSGLLPIAKARARWLTEWAESGANASVVEREYDPTLGQFPCTYCPYLSRCIVEGQGSKKAVELPFRQDDK